MKAAANRIRAHFVGPASTSTDDISRIAAMFIAGTTAAIGVAWFLQSGDSAAEANDTLVIMVEIAPGSVGPHTISVCAGPTSGAMRFNGNASGRLFGGSSRATLVLQEVFA